MTEKLTKRNILVVDDQSDIQFLIKTILEREGYHVRIVGDGVEAIEAIQQQLPDIIVSDIRMPNMNGYELLLRLRNNPDWESIPFIFLTSLADAHEQLLGLSYGADYYLGKPVDVRQLLNCVQRTFRLLDKVQSQQGNSDTAFKGTLKDVAVLELLQLVEMSRKSGTFSLKTSTGKGVIRCHEGKIFRAVAEEFENTRSKLEGVAAIEMMLEWNSGSFSFDPDDVPVIDEVQENISNLLLRWVVDQDNLHSHEMSAKSEPKKEVRKLYIKYEEAYPRLNAIESLQSLMRRYTNVYALGLSCESGLAMLSEKLEQDTLIFFREAHLFYQESLLRGSLPAHAEEITVRSPAGVIILRRVDEDWPYVIGLLTKRYNENLINRFQRKVRTVLTPSTAALIEP